MSTESQFSGLELDQLFKKADQINNVQNGWTKLSSSTDSVLDLDTISNAGNYSVEYWSNGPDALSSYLGCGPLSLVNYQEGSNIRQYVFFFGITYDGYTRVYDQTTKAFSEWQSAKAHDNTSVGTAAPTDPSNKQIWVDTTDPYAPVFKYYDESSKTWKDVIPGDALTKSIYDASNHNSDFYQYADEQIKNVNSSTIYNGEEIDYESHINDAVIHATEKDLAYWEGKASNSKFAAAIQDAKETLKNEVVSDASSFTDDTTQMIDSINELDQNVTTHIEDLNIHLRAPMMYTFGRIGDYSHGIATAMTVANSSIYIFEVTESNNSYICTVYSTTDGVSLTNVGALSGFAATNVDHFVAKTAGGFIYLMTTSITYVISATTPTVISATLSYKCYDVALGGSQYILSADSGKLLISSNGTSFSSLTTIGSTGCYLAYGSGVFMFAAFDGTVKYMVAGTTTINGCTLTGVNIIHGIAALNDKFVVVANNGIFTTTDLATFTEVIANPPITLNATVEYEAKSLISNGLSVMGVYTYNMHQYVYWSTDARRWSMQDLGVTSSDLSQRVYPKTLIAAPDSTFKVCGFVGVYYFTSYDSVETYLNQKAEASHNHLDDGTVKVRASDIQGTLRADLIPDEIKEVSVQVDDLNAMLALTTADVQNGDFIWVKTPSAESTDPALYIVRDYTKLGTMDAFKKYSTGGTAMKWGNISGIPTDISGLGITDLVTKTAIDSSITTLNSLNSATGTTLATSQAKADLLTTANIKAAVKLKSDIDTTQAKLDVILNYTA